MEVWPFYKADKPTSKYSLLTARPGVSLSDDSLDKLAALFPDHQWPHEIHLTYDEEGLTAVEPDTCVGIVVSAGRHAWLANHLQQHRDDHDGVVLFHPHRISDLGMPVCVVVPTHEVDEYVAAVDAATAMWPEGCRPVVIGFHATDGAGAAFPSGFGVQRHCVLAVWRRLLGCELVAVTLDDSIAFLRTGDAVDHSGAAALAEKAKAGDDRVMTACPASANKFSANNVAKFQKLTTPEVVNNLHKMSADYQLDLNMDLPQQAVAWRAVGGFAPDAGDVAFAREYVLSTSFSHRRSHPALHRSIPVQLPAVVPRWEGRQGVAFHSQAKLRCWVRVHDGEGPGAQA